MQALTQKILYPELLDNRTLTELEEILEEYPYFQTANMLYIKNLHNQGKIGFNNKLKKHAIWITNRTKLFYMIGKQILLPNEETKEQEIIDFSNILEVSSTIKTGKLEDPLKKIIEQSIPYAEQNFNLDKEFDLDDFKQTFSKQKSSKEKKALLLDKFIANPSKEKIKPTDNKITEEPPSQETIDNEDFMTETLAKIYTKQELFDKAILIYEKLSLKYPKKSVYFADQIKKLKELNNN